MTVLSRPRTRGLTARTVMSAPAVTVTPDTTPWAAWSTMIAGNIRHLVVVVGDRCVGVVDDREIFAQWPMGPLALRRSKVASIMRPRTTAVLPDTDLRDVAQVMNEDLVDAVPVVDEHGVLLGLVTAGDIVAAVAVNGLVEREGAETCE